MSGSGLIPMAQNQSYPIDGILSELQSAVLGNSAVVLHAPPGAGKTTRVPLALLDAIPSRSGKIVMLEPRRIAAVAAARWMAHLRGEAAGETVGYTIRFDSRVTARTRIEVVTEGVLTRRLQADPTLAGTAMLIFDEFHERSMQADLALALSLDVRKGLRPDLKILIMSATLDTAPVARLLGGAAVLSSRGRFYPVQERYFDERPGRLLDRITTAVRTALRETSGDILVFLPGAGEIRSCTNAVRETLGSSEHAFSLHPLYGDLPFEDQERAILPCRDRRKIVLATNIAETSLTIEGVHVVIDSGLTRVLRYDPATGMNRLVTVPVSRASAEQRKGRAGRVGPGVCYRMYGSHMLQGAPEFTQPEILGSDLSPLVLELAVWGVKDPSELSWLDEPPEAAWQAGRELLIVLGALDRSGSVTSAGREMVRYPLHPRLSRLLLRARKLGCSWLGADLAALLTERDIIRHSGQDPSGDDPDVLERLETLERWRASKQPGRADPAALRSVERTARQLSALLPPGENVPGTVADTELVSRLLLSAFPDRVCKRREEGGRVFVHQQGRGVRLRESSSLVNSPYLIAVAADAGEKAEGFIHLAAPVTEQAIRRECRGLIGTARRVEWDRKDGRIIAALEERLGALVLSSRKFAPDDDEAVPLLCEAIRTTPGLISLREKERQFQGRVALLRRFFPEDGWPDLSEARLLATPEDWLASALRGIRSLPDLRNVNVLPAMKAQLTGEQARILDARAPQAITVPSGSRVSLDYAAGELPVLAVKLQELFGLADSPRIAEGRVTVLLHLLSPARRPVQITRDLRGFWNAVYPEVKKDLKGRYPKHPWPDDPWNAAPTARTKPRIR